MSRLIRSRGFHPRLLAVLTCTLLLPGLASAESLQIRNDTTFAVVVQGSSVVRGALVRDRAHLLSPGDKTPAVVLPGNKIITIYEAKVPNRVLFQGVVPAAAEDQVLNIQVDGARLKLEKQRPKRTTTDNP
jgi:hypothetical protein